MIFNFGIFNYLIRIIQARLKFNFFIKIKYITISIFRFKSKLMITQLFKYFERKMGKSLIFIYFIL